MSPEFGQVAASAAGVHTSMKPRWRMNAGAGPLAVLLTSSNHITRPDPQGLAEHPLTPSSLFILCSQDSWSRSHKTGVRIHMMRRRHRVHLLFINHTRTHVRTWMIAIAEVSSQTVGAMLWSHSSLSYCLTTSCKGLEHHTHARGA